MARKKAGKIIRMALRGTNIASVLKDDYIRGTQQGADAFAKNFVDYLQFYVPQIKQKYLEIIENVTGEKDPKAALHKYLTNKSLYYDRVWRDVVNETSKLAAQYRAEKLQSMPDKISDALAKVGKSVAARKVEALTF